MSIGQEVDRLRHLSSFTLDYDSYYDELQPFINLAKAVTDSPVCEINIIGAYNQWTIARSENELKVIPREESICYDTIQKDDIYEITNLRQDDRYSDRPYVTGDPYFQYYCGVQLTTQEKINIGSICVLDKRSKEITKNQKEKLQYLADLIVQYLGKDRLVTRSKGEISQLKKRFRTLNHDIRNPVNGIVGIVDLLISDEDQVEVSTDDLLTIKECAETIVDEIDGILSKPEETLVLDNEADKLLLAKVFKKVEKLNLPQAKNKGVNFEVASASECYISVYSSRRLIQIISNLIANAIKFTHSGGTVKVDDNVITKDDQDYLEITVVDDGMGMDNKQISAFNAGKTVPGIKGTEGEASFGIGLQHVQQMVSEIGGSIAVESTKDEGTRFIVTIACSKL